MNLLNLRPETIEQIIESINHDPTIEAHMREEHTRWIKLQYEEQKKGGAWKARIREAGHVIWL